MSSESKVPVSSSEDVQLSMLASSPLSSDIEPASPSGPQVQYGPDLPDIDDLDGDGIVKGKDFAFAKRFGRLVTKLTPDEKRAARERVERNYPTGFPNIHPDWVGIEDAIWDNDAVGEIIQRFESVTLKRKDQSKVVTCMFMAAAQSGHLEVIKGLVQRYGSIIQYRARNQIGQTALLMAADFGEWDAVALISTYDECLELADYEHNTAMKIAIERYIFEVPRLIKLGAKMSLDTFISTLGRALDLNAYNTAGFLYAYNHQTQNVRTIVRRLFKLERSLGDRHHEAFNGSSFYIMVKDGLTLNRSPFAGALKMFSLFMELSKKFPAERNAYEAMAANFNRRASFLWNSIPTDITASLVLEQVTDGSVDGPPLEVILESENLNMTVDSRLNRIVREWYQPYDFDRDWLTMFPADLFRMPVVKFFLDAFSYLSFLVVFTVYLSEHQEINSAISSVEWMLFVFGLGYVVNELQQLYQSGFVAYWAEGWNRFDLAMIVSLTVMAVCRIPSWNDDELLVVRPVFLVTVVVMIMAIWVRSLFLFTSIATLGPLLIILRKMTEDIFNFSLLMGVFVVAFYFSYDFLVRGIWTNLGIDNLAYFTGDGSSFRSLVQLGLSGEPMFSFDTIGTQQGSDEQAIAEGLGVLYQLLTGVVLVNLLIAMMGNTYQTVKDNSDAEFAFTNIEGMWRYDQSTNDLPPPLNLIGVILFPFVFVVSRLMEFRGKSYYCAYCHKSFGDDRCVEDKELSDSVFERFPEMVRYRAFPASTDGEPKEHSLVRRLINEGVICSCVRMKRLISGKRYSLEQISVWLFRVIIYLPVLVTTFLFLGFSKVVDCITLWGEFFRAEHDEDEEEEFAEKKDLYENWKDELGAFDDIEVPDLDKISDSAKIDHLLALQDPAYKRRLDKLGADLFESRLATDFNASSLNVTRETFQRMQTSNMSFRQKSV